MGKSLTKAERGGQPSQHGTGGRSTAGPELWVHVPGCTFQALGLPLRLAALGCFSFFPEPTATQVHIVLNYISCRSLQMRVPIGLPHWYVNRLKLGNIMRIISICSLSTE